MFQIKKKHFKYQNFIFVKFSLKFLNPEGKKLKKFDGT